MVSSCRSCCASQVVFNRVNWLVAVSLLIRKAPRQIWCHMMVELALGFFLWLSGVLLGGVCGHLYGYRRGAASEKKKPDLVEVAPEVIWVAPRTSVYHFDADCKAKRSALADKHSPGRGINYTFAGLLTVLICGFSGARTAPQRQLFNHIAASN